MAAAARPEPEKRTLERRAPTASRRACTRPRSRLSAATVRSRALEIRGVGLEGPGATETPAGPIRKIAQGIAVKSAAIDETLGFEGMEKARGKVLRIAFRRGKPAGIAGEAQFDLANELGLRTEALKNGIRPTYAGGGAQHAARQVPQVMRQEGSRKFPIQPDKGDHAAAAQGRQPGGDGAHPAGRRGVPDGDHKRRIGAELAGGVFRGKDGQPADVAGPGGGIPVGKRQRIETVGAQAVERALAERAGAIDDNAFGEGVGRPVEGFALAPGRRGLPLGQEFLEPRARFQRLHYAGPALLLGVRGRPRR